jgi:hypothetical protein
VHYAGAFTGYGPLVAGPNGIKYLTLRAGWDSGFIPISERERMLRGPKRHAESEIFTSSKQQAADGAGNPPTVRPLITFGSDGLGATFASLGADAPFHVAGVSGSLGQFVVVVEGSMHYGDIELGVWESLFVSGDEPPLSLRAGADGTGVVAMHMPRVEAAYRQSPVG